MGNRGKIVFGRYDGSNNPSPRNSVPLNDNTSHHVVGVKRSANLELYIDGSFDMSTPDTTVGSTTNTDDLWIGAGAVGGIYHFNGALDEIAIFNRALSAAEIQSLHAASIFCSP